MPNERTGKAALFIEWYAKNGNVAQMALTFKVKQVREEENREVGGVWGGAGILHAK